MAALQDCVLLLTEGYSQFCANEEWSGKTIREVCSQAICRSL